MYIPCHIMYIPSNIQKFFVLVNDLNNTHSAIYVDPLGISLQKIQDMNVHKKKTVSLLSFSSSSVFVKEDGSNGERKEHFHQLYSRQLQREWIIRLTNFRELAWLGCYSYIQRSKITDVWLMRIISHDSSRAY